MPGTVSFIGVPLSADVESTAVALLRLQEERNHQVIRAGLLWLERIQTSIIRDLPRTHLQESPFNPRKRFQQNSLEGLAQSIRSQGVLAPLLVRELEPERFEIVAGSRRFRASQIAGIEQVPIRVVSRSDAEAQLAMAIENLQREDVHPFEEARAFAKLASWDPKLDPPVP